MRTDMRFFAEEVPRLIEAATAENYEETMESILKGYGGDEMTAYLVVFMEACINNNIAVLELVKNGAIKYLRGLVDPTELDCSAAMPYYIQYRFIMDCVKEGLKEAERSGHCQVFKCLREHYGLGKDVIEKILPAHKVTDVSVLTEYNKFV